MSQGINLAVVGATSLVGEAILEILEQKELPVETLTLLDSGESVGKSLQFNEKSHRVESVGEFDFTEVQLAIFVAADDISEEYVQQAADQGCIVIDSSEVFRYEYDVPLIVSEVNSERIAEYSNRGIISTPSAASVPLLMAVAPIHRHASIKRINVATYQAVSESGKQGVEELAGQTAKLLNGQTLETKTFAKQIAFNVLPQMGGLNENGYSYEEMSLVRDVQKVLGDEGVMVNPTCVQVPVFFGHGEAVHIECWDPVSAEEVKELFSYSSGINVVDGEEGYATAVTEAAKNHDVFISRIREDISCENALDLWLVADNVKQGTALNCVQIAEVLVNQYL
ncbi:MAG: aspartate-semialdehyde dehydrogenase [Neptuniibacter sp.]